MRRSPADTVCDLCGLDRPKVLWKRRAYSIVKCPRCGLVYTVLDWNLNLAQIYEDEAYYRGSRGREKPSRMQIIRQRVKAITRYINKGRLLDVGCGSGTFLEMAGEEGFDALGLEVSSVAARMAAERGKVTMGDGSLLPFRNNSFHVVALWDVIEHVVSPLQVLTEAQRVLKSNGLLSLSVPNAVPFPGAHLLGRRLKSGRWRVYKFEEAGHLYHFSRHTIRALLIKAGFSVIKSWDGEIPLGGSILDKFALCVLRATKLMQKMIRSGSSLIVIARRMEAGRTGG